MVTKYGNTGIEKALTQVCKCYNQMASVFSNWSSCDLEISCT